MGVQDRDWYREWWREKEARESKGASKVQATAKRQSTRLLVSLTNSLKVAVWIGIFAVAFKLGVIAKQFF